MKLIGQLAPYGDDIHVLLRCREGEDASAFVFFRRKGRSYVRVCSDRGTEEL